MANDEILQQDLEQVGPRPGMVFIAHLLMEEKCNMPDKEFMHGIMTKHLGDIDCFAHDGKVAEFAVKKYVAQYKDASVPPALMITDCLEIKQPLLDNLALSQLWNCKEGADIIDKCRYQVIATDMLAAGLEYKDRAEMLVDYVEALMEIYPTCKAIVFDVSKKMHTREAILNCNMPKECKYIYYAVNVRFFKIEGTEDMIVDTIGMSTLCLPDLQYHFHGLNPNHVVNHAYNVLSYIYDNNCPINSGDHIDGIKDGEMSQEVQWNVQYEDALIQPMRVVIDFNMNEYAAGQRQ